MQCDRGTGKRPEAKKSVKGQVKGQSTGQTTMDTLNVIKKKVR